MAKTSRPKPASRTQRVAAGKTYRVLVDVGPHETVRNLHRFRLDHCCMPQRPPDLNGARSLHAFASGRTVAALRRAGRKVRVLADADIEGARAREFIGKGDRFRGGRSGPRGVGRLV
jgi:hypothetical protein